MKKLLAVRIVRWPFKLIYVVVVWLGLRYGVSRLLSVGSVEIVLADILRSALELAVILYGARIFRGPGEPVEPPRPLWRMTTRSSTSFTVGILFIVLNVLSLPGLIYGLALNHRPELLVAGAISVLALVVVIWLYLRSGIRLRRAELATEPPPTDYPFHGRVLDFDGPTTRIPVDESVSTSAGTDTERGLLSPSKDGRRIHVHVGDTRIGSLPGGAVEIRDLIARTGGRVRVELVRTGDQLWAEVPTDGLVEAATSESPATTPDESAPATS